MDGKRFMESALCRLNSESIVCPSLEWKQEKVGMNKKSSKFSMHIGA